MLRNNTANFRSDQIMSRILRTRSMVSNTTIYPIIIHGCILQLGNTRAQLVCALLKWQWIYVWSWRYRILIIVGPVLNFHACLVPVLVSRFRFPLLNTRDFSHFGISSVPFRYHFSYNSGGAQTSPKLWNLNCLEPKLLKLFGTKIQKFRFFWYFQFWPHSDFWIFLRNLRYWQLWNFSGTFVQRISGAPLFLHGADQ